MLNVCFSRLTLMHNIVKAYGRLIIKYSEHDKPSASRWSLGGHPGLNPDSHMNPRREKITPLSRSVDPAHI